MKKTKKKKKTHVPFRMNVLFFVVFLLFSSLILRLGVVQIVFGEDFKREIQRTEDVTVNTSVPRGKIFDTNGKAVVDNTPLNAITYTRTQSTTQEEELDVAKKLAKLIDKPADKVTEREKKDYWILKHPKLAEQKITDAERKKFQNKQIDDKELYQLQLDRITDKELKSLSKSDLEILAIYREMISGYNLVPQIIKNKGVTPKEFAVVSEHLSSLPGVDITTDWDRYYAYGTTLKSILGKVSNSDQGLPRELADYYVARGYSRNDRVGTSYIEQQYEDVLQGTKAKVKNVTDKDGNVIDTETITDGQRGKDLVLSIDIELQKRVEKIIEDELMKAKSTPGHELLDRAFVTMMDPYTGEILAMAGKQYEIDEKTKKPVLNDFSLGNFTTSYAMGSAVKGATVLTGYKTGALEPGQKIFDEPLLIKGTKEKSSYKNFGLINDLQALKFSSNVYMFKTAIKIGGGVYRPNEPLHINMDAFDTMRNSFKQFGLGSRTGIDLPGEQVGYEGYTQAPGLLLDFAIGQFDTYTPLQLAQYMSTIANGGYRMQPHIVKEIREPVEKSGEMGPIVEEVEPKVLNRLDMKPSWIDHVKEGFRLVAQEQGGTAYSAFYAGTVSSHPTDYKPAAKTGTAEGLYDGPKRQDFVKAGKDVPMTWNLTLAGYAPNDHPEVAFSVVVPWAYQDDPRNPRTNTNIGKKILDAYFDIKKERQEKGLDKATSIQKVENIDDVEKGQAKARKENDSGALQNDSSN